MNERERLLGRDIKRGDVVVFYHQDLPASPSPLLEQHRKDNGYAPSQNAVVLESHGDGFVTLQVITMAEMPRDRVMTEQQILPLSGKVYSRVPQGFDSRSSNIWRVVQ